MKPERHFPRFDIRVVTRGDVGFAAFLIDHDSGDSWVFDHDLTWKRIRRSSKAAKTSAVRKRSKKR
jgi:hypothetical protein